jgi:hypothetical protein
VTTLAGRWRTEADGAGWEPETWLAALWRTQERQLALSTEIEQGVVDGLVAELAESRSTWGRGK